MDLEFSKRLKRFRERFGWSVSDVAKALDISQSTYREWEYGRKISGHESFLKLAALFQISLDELMLGATARTPDPSELFPDIEEIEKLLEKHKRFLNRFFDRSKDLEVKL
jgi:transcriptional regulator with XRE-family HTH domain